MITRRHSISHPPYQQFQYSNGTSAIPENIQQGVPKTGNQSQSVPTSPAPRYRILRTVSQRLIPVIFVTLFLISGTTILVYTLALHLPLPPTTVIAVAITFGVIIGLFLFTLLLLYFLEPPKGYSSSDAENNTKSNHETPEWVNVSRRWKRLKERVSWPMLWFRRSHNEEDPGESSTERVSGRWDKLRRSRFGRFWGISREDNKETGFKVHSAWIRGEHHNRNPNGVENGTSGCHNGSSSKNSSPFVRRMFCEDNATIDYYCNYYTSATRS